MYMIFNEVDNMKINVGANRFIWDMNYNNAVPNEAGSPSSIERVDIRLTGQISNDKVRQDLFLGHGHDTDPVQLGKADVNVDSNSLTVDSNNLTGHQYRVLDAHPAPSACR